LGGWSGDVTEAITSAPLPGALTEAAPYRSIRRPWDAVAWWEFRRPLYNLVLLLAGFVSIFVVEWIGSYSVAPGEDVIEPVLLWIGIVAYGGAANLAYTIGWISELLWSGGQTARTQAYRKRIFLAGLIFSVLLTLAPAAIVPLLWLIARHR
jgi:hypothetical protein